MHTGLFPLTFAPATTELWRKINVRHEFRRTRERVSAVIFERLIPVRRITGHNAMRTQTRRRRTRHSYINCYIITLGTRRMGVLSRNVTKCPAVGREAAGFGVIYGDENNIDYRLRSSAPLTRSAVGNPKDREKNKIGP